MNKLVKLAPYVIKLFSKPKLDGQDRSKLINFSSILANNFVNIERNPELFSKMLIELNVELGSIDYRTGDPNQINNTFGLGAFYLVLSNLISDVINFNKEEEDLLFLLEHGLKYNLRPILKNVEENCLPLDDLRKNIASNTALMTQLEADNRTIDQEICFLFDALVLVKYHKGNSPVYLQLRGANLLEQLAWIEDFNGSHADLIIGLIKKKALQIKGF